MMSKSVNKIDLSSVCFARKTQESLDWLQLGIEYEYSYSTNVKNEISYVDLK